MWEACERRPGSEEPGGGCDPPADFSEVVRAGRRGNLHLRGTDSVPAKPGLLRWMDGSVTVPLMRTHCSGGPRPRLPPLPSCNPKATPSRIKTDIARASTPHGSRQAPRFQGLWPVIPSAIDVYSWRSKTPGYRYEYSGHTETRGNGGRESGGGRSQRRNTMRSRTLDRPVGLSRGEEIKTRVDAVGKAR